MEPWGISGPQFVWLYAVALVGTLVISFWIRRGLARAAPPTPSQPLSVEEMAFLTGGMNRVVDAAIARLVEVGVLRVQRNGTLQHTGTVVRTTLDGEVVQAVQRSPRTVAQVRQELRRSPLVGGFRRRLVERGLLHSESAGQKLLIQLPVLVLFGIGTARLVNGIELARPVGLLAGLLVVTLLLLVFRLKMPRRLATTRAATQLIHRVRQAGPTQAHRLLPVAALTGAAGLVVIGGLEAFPDKDIAMALGPSAPMHTAGSSPSASSCGGSSSGSSCGSSCSSSSSSCGGGGGCGG